MGKYKKRADKHMDTIEKKYGPDTGVQFDKPLGKYLKEKGYPSLAKLLKPIEDKIKSEKK